METIQIKIEPCPDNNTSHQRPTRSRKISFDHGRHGNPTDTNGNYSHRMLTRRRSGCETSGLLTSIPMRKNSLANLDSDIPDWQKSLVKQIENLVVNAKHTDSIKTEIENEMHDLDVINEGMIPSNHPEERSRTRRKSFMHSGNLLHPNRKISHSNFGHGHIAGHAAHSINQVQTTNTNTGRRKSYANIEHHISRSRRSGSVGNIKETLSVRGRRSSVCHHGTFLIPPLRQRRKSSVKPPTFTVTKITSVQRKLHNIYRRRRRKELRHVEQIIPPTIIIDHSDDDINQNTPENGEPDNDINEKGKEFSQIINNLEETVDGINDNVTPNTQSSDVENSDCNLNIEEPIPIARRKCSIQMRYFEISRKLRQRRKNRKQGSVNSEEGDNDTETREDVRMRTEHESLLCD